MGLIERQEACDLLHLNDFEIPVLLSRIRNWQDCLSCFRRSLNTSPWFPGAFPVVYVQMNLPRSKTGKRLGGNSSALFLCLQVGQLY